MKNFFEINRALVAKKKSFFLAALFCIILCSAEAKEPTSYNYQRGLECLQNHNFDEGKKFLQKELQQNRKNGYAYTWLASAYNNENEYGNAIYNLEQALKYLPKSEKHYRSWAHSVRGDIYFAMKDTVSGLKEYALAIKAEPTNAGNFLERGDIYRQLRQWDKSDADFRHFIKLTPGIIRGHMELGDNLMAQKKYEEALNTYRYAHQLAPRAFTYSAMADAELKLRQYETAAEHIINALEEDVRDDKAGDVMLNCKEETFIDLMLPKIDIQIRKNPNTLEWLGYKAAIFARNKRYYESIEVLQQLRTLDASPGVDDMISTVYRKIGDYASALHAINLAIEGDTTDASMYRQRMFIYFEMDSLSLCMQDAQQLIDRHPEESGHYLDRGQLYFFLKDYQKVIDDITLGLAIDPSYHYARYQRGRCYLALGDSAKAQADFERAHKDSPRAITRAFAAASLGLPDEARAIADSVLIADSIDHDERYNVACAFSLIEDTERAFSVLEEELADGYVDFHHLRLDPDFESMHGPRFDSLVSSYERRVQDIIRAHSEATDTLSEQARVVEVPFSPANGVTKVDCTINGLPLNFIFDTGASDVTISQTEANFMFKNGYLSDKDVMGKQRYQTADGNISIGTVINLRQINFGGLELSNVRASVVKSQNAPLLLGQSVLQRLGKIEIDNENRVLKITTKK